MTEASLFLLVGFISIAAAVGMLLSSKAVHSALFLILIMVCIAFMFLLLNAPFLAMVQITVYAGAIMVLFLFVIMLLGAEQLLGTTERLRWITLPTLVLALLFFVVAAIAIGQGQVNEQTPSASQPLLRVAHFAPGAGVVDVYANGEQVVSNLAYSASTDFLSLPAGDYNLALYEAGTQNALLAANVILEPGFTGTVIAYDAPQTTLAVIPDDLSTVTEDRSGRVVLFNGYGELPAIGLVDLGLQFDDEDTEVIIESLPQGAASEPIILPENSNLGNWGIVEAGDITDVVARFDAEVFTIERNTSQLLIVASEQNFDGTLQARTALLSNNAAAAFGSPIAMGQMLFTRYLLPMQMVAVLLLVAMVGAIILTHQPRGAGAIERRASGRRKVSRPLTSVVAHQIGQEALETNGHNSNGVALPDSVDEPASN